MVSSPVIAPIRIMIVDDHPMLRAGVASVIAPRDDMEVVGEASTGEESIELFQTLLPDITLMDIHLPGVDGVGAIEAIRRSHPDARIIVLTTYAGDTQALRAIRAGAAGYLLKSGLRRELLDSIRTVHAGRRSVAPEIAQEMALYAGGDRLSEREVDVLRQVALGQSNKEVARTLTIAEDTVKTHLRSIFGKLDVEDRTHAVTVALRRGIITL